MRCDWFILPLLLPIPTICFSLDHKRNVSDRIVSGVGRKWKRADSSSTNSVLSRSWLRLRLRFWFSLGHKRSYDSSYDSDSVASENQPFGCLRCACTEAVTTFNGCIRPRSFRNQPATGQQSPPTAHNRREYTNGTTNTTTSTRDLAAEWMPLRKPALIHKTQNKPVRLKSCTKLMVSTSNPGTWLKYTMEGSLLEFPQVVVHFGHVFT